MRRKVLWVSALVFMVLFAVAPLMSLSVNAEASAEKPRVETTDVQPAATIFTETFEGAFPGTAWTVGDWDPNNGLDYWDDTSYRAHSGSWSGWCAQVGSGEKIIFTEDFEGAFPGTAWVVGDWNPNNGFDYWDDTNVRAYLNYWSCWCNGYPDPTATHYDDNMNAYMYRAVSLSGCTSVSLSYNYYLRCESGWDYLQVMYLTDSWHFIDTHTGDLGDAWHFSTVSIPASATYVGFRFYSDDSISTLIGAYIDNVWLSGYQSNSAAHKYDNGMYAYMYRGVSLSAYGYVMLSYYYWVNCEGYDMLSVMYQSGGTWYHIDYHSGNSGGWKYSIVGIPNTATAVGFCFSSDNIDCDWEGAYIDDVVIAGASGELLVETINAYCSTEGAYVSVPITMDGSLTGYSTPHTFYVYDLATHTFTVPSTDANGHQFKQWSTGSTSTTITVSSSGTYTAYYGATTVDTVLDFTFTPNPVAPGTTVTLSGTLKTTGGTAMYPASVTVEYSTDGGATWNYAWTLNTNAAGQFSKSFTAPGTPGTYLVRVSYAGSATYNPSSHTETLTVTAAAPPTVEIWTDKAAYARGDPLKAYVQLFNPGPAITVKVNVWFGLPSGGKYLLETYYLSLPASYTSPVYTWKTVTIPTSAAAGTYSVNAEMRNPTTNALIDSDTYTFTIT